MHLMLPVCSPVTNWWVWLDAAAYILLPQCIMGNVTWDPPEYYGIVGKTDWQTNRSENITFPQTTYAGGNKETEILVVCRKLPSGDFSFSWKPDIKVQQVMVIWLWYGRKLVWKLWFWFMDLKCEDAVHNSETVYVHKQMDSDNNFQVTKPVSNG